jgi:hypothetical protein
MRLQSHHAIRSFLTACATASRQLSASIAKGPKHEAEGIIQAVDPIGRELTLKTHGTTVTFYVPLDCPITLNDERVKMRLLQPMDWATVWYSRRSEHPIACSVVVDWDAADQEAEPQATSVPQVNGPV